MYNNFLTTCFQISDDYEQRYLIEYICCSYFFFLSSIALLKMLDFIKKKKREECHNKFCTEQKLHGKAIAFYEKI